MASSQNEQDRSASSQDEQDRADSTQDEQDRARIYRIISHLYKYRHDDRIRVEEYDGKLYMLWDAYPSSTNETTILPSMSAFEAFETVLDGDIGIEMDLGVADQLAEQFKLDTPAVPVNALRIETNHSIDFTIILGTDDALAKLMSKVVGTADRRYISDSGTCEFKPKDIVVLHPITSAELEGMKKANKRNERKRKYDEVMHSISEKVKSGAITLKAAQYLEGCAVHIVSE